MLFIYLATLITNLTPMQDRWRAKLKSLAFKSSAIVVLPLASDTPFRILVFEDFIFLKSRLVRIFIMVIALNDLFQLVYKTKKESNSRIAL